MASVARISLFPKDQRARTTPFTTDSKFTTGSKFLFCPFGRLDCLKRWWAGSGEERAGNGRGTGEARRGTGECKGARGEGGKRSCLEGVNALAGQSETYYLLRGVNSLRR